MGNDSQWFAMRATYRREIMAQDYLNERGIKTFIPMRTVVKVVRGIKRKLREPAISGLVFAYAPKETIQAVKLGLDYIQYLTRKKDGRNVPIVVPTAQMEQFMQVVLDDTVEKSFFAPGEIEFAAGTKVRVHGGAFDGLEGVLVKIKGKQKKQFLIELEGICAVGPVTIHPDLLEIVKE